MRETHALTPGAAAIIGRAHHPPEYPMHHQWPRPRQKCRAAFDLPPAQLVFPACSYVRPVDSKPVAVPALSFVIRTGQFEGRCAVQCVQELDRSIVLKPQVKAHTLLHCISVTWSATPTPCLGNTPICPVSWSTCTCFRTQVRSPTTRSTASD